ncbi:MAG: hypothetical protein BZY88_06035 [SAR202 cluster bacterium Io17-Chloro-G9]|nr:MAG: hypothetical protein BZY88_06035 [SAR202 cluster bacterium Io17-Chloro-G9]
MDQQTASIYAPIKTHLDQVEATLAGLCRNDNPELVPLLDHVLNSGGKRIRPAITLLAAAFYPHDPKNPIIMAGAVELLHLAALIHDDTVDDSDLRRGKTTVSNQWGKHVAVLFGDYVFATSATFVCDTNNIRVVRRFSETIMELASGELVEVFSAFDPKQARLMYQERIYRKTASLFCTAAETGSILSGAPEPQIQALRDYGYNIGMAFQIVDDLLDVQGDSAKLGKPVGADLRQGVLTLPTIMLMERYPDDNPIEALFKDPTQDAKVGQVLEMINNTDIIDNCYAIIREYSEKAIRCLDILPKCDAGRSLLNLCDYIWERSR